METSSRMEIDERTDSESDGEGPKAAATQKSQKAPKEDKKSETCQPGDFVRYTDYLAFVLHDGTLEESHTRPGEKMRWEPLQVPARKKFASAELFARDKAGQTNAGFKRSIYRISGQGDDPNDWTTKARGSIKGEEPLFPPRGKSVGKRSDAPDPFAPIQTETSGNKDDLMSQDTTAPACPSGVVAADGSVSDSYSRLLEGDVLRDAWSAACENKTVLPGGLLKLKLHGGGGDVREGLLKAMSQAAGAGPRLTIVRQDNGKEYDDPVAFAADGEKLGMQKAQVCKAFGDLPSDTAKKNALNNSAKSSTSNPMKQLDKRCQSGPSLQASWMS